MCSTFRQSIFLVMRSRKRYQCLAALVAFFLLTAGCDSQEPFTYAVPEDVYGLTFEKTAFVPDVYEYSPALIESGTKLSRNDLQFRVNKSLTLQMGNSINVNSYKFVREFNYGENGVIKEYTEATGNYKLLVAEREGVSYLLALLTISKYMPTPRNISNGLSEEALDILMGPNTFVTREERNQMSRIYTVGSYQLIISLQDGVVRAIQMIAGGY